MKRRKERLAATTFGRCREAVNQLIDSQSHIVVKKKKRMAAVKKSIPLLCSFTHYIFYPHSFTTSRQLLLLPAGLYSCQPFASQVFFPFNKRSFHSLIHSTIPLLPAGSYCQPSFSSGLSRIIYFVLQAGKTFLAKWTFCPLFEHFAKTDFLPTGWDEMSVFSFLFQLLPFSLSSIFQKLTFFKFNVLPHSRHFYICLL